mgnify:FL=1
MKKILVISPHPDDETLGCGGTLLKHRSKGDQINCLLITSPNKYHKLFKKYQNIFKKINQAYKFKNFLNLNLEATKLDTVKNKLLIDMIAKCIIKIKPNILYIPCPYDAHEDHKKIYNAMIPFTKSFRYPYIKEILIYETLSETNFDVMEKKSFKPNHWIDISKFINKKIKIMRIYKSELKNHPFPRSKDSIISLAKLRGSFSNCKYAESFNLIKKIT